MDESIDRLYRETIRGLNPVLDAFGGRGVIVGGVAVGLLSVPRYTKDVDGLLVLDIASAESFLKVAAENDFEPLFSGMAEFARQSRLVALRYRPTGVRVDIALGCMPFEEEVEQRAQTYRDEDLSIRLPTVEDLIIMKAIAHRGQDLVDIQKLAQFNPKLDRKRIRHWVKQFSEILELPTLWQEIEALLDSE